jgi:hypothetical protein
MFVIITISSYHIDHYVNIEFKPSFMGGRQPWGVAAELGKISEGQIFLNRPAPGSPGPSEGPGLERPGPL